jgi:chorismate mutase
MGDSASVLAQLRDEIDGIDAAILELLAQRAELVLRVGEVKRGAGIAVYDRDREQRILERLGGLAREPLDQLTVRCVFERIIEASRQIEERHVDSRPQHD